MKDFTTYINEAKNKNVSYDTYSGAVQKALDDVEKRGFEYDEDVYMSISTMYKKPSVGKTVSWKLPLTKNGKEVRQRLIVNVYGLESGKYELNHYIS